MLQMRYPRLMHPLVVSEFALGGSSGADKMVKEVVVSGRIRETKNLGCLRSWSCINAQRRVLRGVLCR